MVRIYSRGIQDDTENMCRVGTAPCTAGWAEALPKNCPPAKAVDPSGERAYRFVTSPKAVSAEDFYSNARLNIASLSGTPDCGTSSVSVWDVAKSDIQKVRKFASKKSKQLVIVAIPLDSGLISARDDGHIHWWPCASCDPVKLVEHQE